MLVRKGNEQLLKNNQVIGKLYIWDKTSGKLRNLRAIARDVRKEKYDCIINLQRFASTGWLVWRSKAPERIGFDKNPFAFCYTRKVKHIIGDGRHETERNQELISHITDNTPERPDLHLTREDYMTVDQYRNGTHVCIAPASVWFTKQFPDVKWIELIGLLDPSLTIYLLGSMQDSVLCERIAAASAGKKIVNLCGKLNLLQSAALMENAVMNYVNDSAPLHLASAVNAKVTAVFCSTVPSFGFGPLSHDSRIAEIKGNLPCRPCGLHGKDYCPEKHFRCAGDIDVKTMLP
ncbi:MAG: glycosyltransferase family 9 protein [Bacteroidota bacterium]